ncbi:MAG: FIST N-terminal domain-containing protein, partial [Draconibacterium sp.]|nr:FIST N-terminal domain-containing protein [Draconibacterium sp.]
MKAKSITGNSTEEIKSALEQSMVDARPDDQVGRGYKPTLAFVFISIKQDIDAVSNLLDQQGIRIFGATTGGEFIDGDIGAGSIAILLLDMEPGNFMVLLEDYSEIDPEVLTQTMARKAKEQFKNPSFILSNSIAMVNSVELGEPILRAIESVTGKDTIVWGGRAGDDFLFDETVVFTNNKTLKRGILMLVLDGDKILVKGQAASGQKPVGTEKTITKMADNWIYELDNQPATEMVMKYLGLKLTEEETIAFNPINYNIMFSVAREKGDPIIRGVGAFNWKEKAVFILASIKEGDKVRFTLQPDFEIVEEVIS